MKKILSVLAYVICIGISVFALTSSVKISAQVKDEIDSIPSKEYKIHLLQTETRMGEETVKGEVLDIIDYIVMQVIYEDGFKIKDSIIPLTFRNQTYGIPIKGIHTINYNSSRSKTTLDDNIVISITNNSNDVPDGTILIKDEDNNLFITGKRTLEKNVIITIRCPTTADEIQTTRDFVEGILKSTRKAVYTDVIFYNLQFHKVKEITISDNLALQMDHQFLISPIKTDVPFNKDNGIVKKVDIKDELLEEISWLEKDVEMWKATYAIVDFEETKETETSVYYLLTENQNFQLVISK